MKYLSLGPRDDVAILVISNSIGSNNPCVGELSYTVKRDFTRLTSPLRFRWDPRHLSLGAGLRSGVASTGLIDSG